jgi:hypothetical protein
VVTGRDDSIRSGAGDLVSLQQAALGDGEELQQIYSALLRGRSQPLFHHRAEWTSVPG